MQEVNMKVNELIFLVEDDPEGGYNAKVLGQSIFVQGDTFESLKDNIKDAVNCHFDTKEEIPAIIRLHIVREEMFAYA
jgi:predicted RNase H-like HicB family nuclease